MSTSIRPEHLPAMHTIDASGAAGIRAAVASGSVSIHTSWDSERGVYTGAIKTYTRDRETWNDTHTATLHAAQVTINDYSREIRTGYLTAYHGTVCAMNASERTAFARLVTGSAFALVWTRSNSSPVLDNAGLVRDELRIRIASPASVRNGTLRCEEYLVAVQVGLDNTARMIRRA